MTRKNKIPKFIDNVKVNLISIFQDILKKKTNKIKIASGFFFISGLKNFIDYIDLDLINDPYYIETFKTKSPFLLIIGDETNKFTKKSMVLAYQYKLKRRILQIIKNDLINITEENIDLILKFHELIQIGIIHVKLYIKRRFHPKLYLFNYKKIKNRKKGKFILPFFKKKKKLNNDIAFLGSSNFTRSGLKTNIELNTVFVDKNSVNWLNEWYINLWRDAEEFNEELLNIIENVTLYKKFKKDSDMYYYLPLKEFAIAQLKNKKNYLLENPAELAFFQIYDLMKMSRILEKFNGVLLSSSVGLGKSYIVCQYLIKEIHNNKKILFIIPPNIENQWKDYLTEFRINPKDVNFISLYIFGQKNFQIDLNYDIIVIDEVHNFRNNESKRYRNLIKSKKIDQKFILISATPLNNSNLDLFNIINIFFDEQLFKIHGIYKYFYNLKEFIKKVEIPMQKCETDDELKKIIKENKKVIEEHEYQISKLRENLIVQTNRLDLKYMKEEYYKLKNVQFFVKDPILFPLKYIIKHIEFRDLFKTFQENIFDLNLPYFKINPNKRQNVIALFDILLSKRLESCLFAFHHSILNLYKTEKLFLDLLIGNIPEDDIFLEKFKILFEDISQEDLADEYISSYLDDFFENPDYDREELIVKTEEDIEILKQILNEINIKISTFNSTDFNDFLNYSEEICSEKNLNLKNIYNYDDKLNLLLTFLDDQSQVIKESAIKFEEKDEELSSYEGINNPKFLIFTQFIDTAKYLTNNIKNSIIITGKDNLTKKREKLELFKTSSNINILISTDTLSEGVNIPEADWVINYDVPWNPVRLIQRIGRVDRITNEKIVYVANFIPDPIIRFHKKLITRVRSKIKNIIKTLGMDYCVLTFDEQIDIIQKSLSFEDELLKKIEDIGKLSMFSLEKSLPRKKFSALEILLLKMIEKFNISKEDLQFYRGRINNIYTSLEGTIIKKLFIYERANQYFNELYLKSDNSWLDESQLDNINFNIEKNVEEKEISESDKQDIKLCKEKLENIRTKLQEEYRKKYEDKIVENNKAKLHNIFKNLFLKNFIDEQGKEEHLKHIKENFANKWKAVKNLIITTAIKREYSNLIKKLIEDYSKIKSYDFQERLEQIATIEKLFDDVLELSAKKTTKLMDFREISFNLQSFIKIKNIKSD